MAVTAPFTSVISSSLSMSVGGLVRGRECVSSCFCIRSNGQNKITQGERASLMLLLYLKQLAKQNNSGGGSESYVASASAWENRITLDTCVRERVFFFFHLERRVLSYLPLLSDDRNLNLLPNIKLRFKLQASFHK